MRPDIDCTGLKCPEPVMRTRKMMDEQQAGFTVLVDNATARDNVTRSVRGAGREATVTEQTGRFLIKAGPADDGPVEAPGAVGETSATGGNKVLLVSSDAIGSAEPELGRALMKMFLYTACQSSPKPDTLIFVNSGVRLVTENEEAIEHVLGLEASGTEVLVCGTCLDYYGLKESLSAGRVSNMYEIYLALIGAEQLLSL